MKLSVIVCTRNRPDKVSQCLKSVLDSNFSDFEIIVVDQSKKLTIKVKSERVNRFRMAQTGLSKSRNFGLKKAEGEIVAFTDDDCIVDRNWLRRIADSFETEEEVSAVFGKVLPYQPEKHKKQICPCVFLRERKRIIDAPCLHWQKIGFGNNMAFKKEVFRKFGGFKEWLGIGSVGRSAEDAEFTLRLLLNGKKILFNPKVKVYHNRWLTKEEFKKQNLSYCCGEMACYGYLAFKGLKLGRKVVRKNFTDSYWKLRKAAKKTLFLKKRGLRLLTEGLKELCFRFRGLLVAFWFSKDESFILRAGSRRILRR